MYDKTVIHSKSENVMLWLSQGFYHDLKSGQDNYLIATVMWSIWSIIAYICIDLKWKLAMIMWKSLKNAIIVFGRGVGGI